MKKKFLFAMALTTALFAGCSDDTIVGDGGQNEGGTQGDGAFVALKLSLPSSSNNGKAYSEAFDEGKAEEYKVNKVNVYYFNEAGSCIESKEYNDIAWQHPAYGTSITSEATLPVEKVSKDAKSVLVVLNQSNKLIINKQETATTKTDIENALSIDALSDVIGTNKNDFMMTNAALNDGTLYVNVTPQTTATAAQADARTVYVERVVGKVTFSPATTTGWSTSDGMFSYTVQETDGDKTNPEGYVGDKVTLTKFVLDVTNKKFFPLQKVNFKNGTNELVWNDSIKNSVNRFVTSENYFGNTYYPQHETSKKAAQVEWAIDPNYDKYVEEDFTKIAVADTTSKFVEKMTGIDYCLENTFNVGNMDQRQTTRALIQGVYVPHSFTKFDGTKDDSYKAGSNWYTLGDNKKAYNKATLEEMFGKMLNKTVTIDETKFEAGTQDFNEQMFSIKESTDEVSDVNAQAEDKEEENTDVATLKSKLKNVTCYKNGVCYYGVRIKHFGDELTPWGTPDFLNYTLTHSDENVKNYLGRYGVVRNNWYQLTVNKVSAPGSPVIPETPNNPDDEQNYYLQTTIKILDWAVRKQGVDL